MTRPIRPPALRPSTAERARTVASRPAAAICAAGIDGSRVLAHTTTAHGQVLLVVPTDGEVCTAVRGSADGDLAALLMVTDHAPVPLQDAVRAQVWLSGWLTPVEPGDQQEALLAFADAAPVGALLDVGSTATLLALDLAEVVLGEGGTVTELDPDDYLAAAPDPVAEVEAHMLQHLDASHPEQLARLASRVPREWVDGGAVRPLGLDRFRFRLRIEQRAGHRDVRVPFSAPVSGPEQLGAAVQRLLCAAGRSCPGR